MTDEGRRYVELAAELKLLDANASRYDEVSAEMDRLWWQLGDSEQEEIEGFLIAADEVECIGNGYPPAGSDG